jgi:ABC-2 type transport system permease protein
MFDVIYIMWIRQLTRYVRSKARLFSSLTQPLLFLFGLWFGFGSIYQRAGGGDYLQFLAPGIISMAITLNAMFNGLDVIWDRKFGFLKETLVAPVSRLTIVIGRTLGGATVATIQGTVVMIIATILGFHPVSLMAIPLAIVFMFLIGTLYTTVGTAIASKMEDVHSFPLIMNFLTMPMVFVSGALFPINSLPAPLQIVAKINPLTYAVDGVRGALTGSGIYPTFFDLTVVTCLLAVAFTITAYLFSKIEV